MKNKKLVDINSPYDVEEIAKASKKACIKEYLLLLFWGIIALASGLGSALLAEKHVWVFAIGVPALFIASFFGNKQLKKLQFFNFSVAHGEVADVLKEATTERSITGGYGMYVKRKYDAFAKDAIRLTVSIKDVNDVSSYVLNGVTEEHLRYYETKGEAMHVPGTYFPVKLEFENEKWLCPICGEFNGIYDKNCRACHKKILK